MPLKLQSGERLVRKINPHPLAFSYLYALWAYLIALGMFFAINPDRGALFLCIGALVPVVLLLRVSPRLALGVAAACGASLMVSWTFGTGQPLSTTDVPAWLHRLNGGHLMAAIGLMGLLAAEIHRLGHRYYVTTRRLVLEAGWLRPRRRSVLYDKITDISVYRPFLGRLFNYGTVTPFTGRIRPDLMRAAMEGLSEDKARPTPARADEQLYCVPDPDGVHDLIVSMLYDY